MKRSCSLTHAQMTSTSSDRKKCDLRPSHREGGTHAAVPQPRGKCTATAGDEYPRREAHTQSRGTCSPGDEYPGCGGRMLRGSCTPAQKAVCPGGRLPRPIRPYARGRGPYPRLCEAQRCRQLGHVDAAQVVSLAELVLEYFHLVLRERHARVTAQLPLLHHLLLLVACKGRGR